MRGQREELVVEENERDEQDGFHDGEDAAEAHRQVLEMSATIEILTRDFENLQRELLDAYKKLQEYSEQDPRLHPNRTVSPSKIGTTITGGIVSNAMAKLRLGNYDGCGCSHEADVHELKQIVSVKDTALTEALHERNEYKLRLERAEAMIRELQCGGESDRHRSSSRTGSVHIQTSSRTSSFSGGSVPYGMTSTSPVHVTPSVMNMSSTATSLSSGSSNRELPKHERFDQESSYQSKEDDELFWRRQYRDAVRMRKHQGQPAGTATIGGGSGGGSGGAPNARPSLKIFSYPNSNRQKGITDENVPFTRYIGISTRQNEIIKEKHRLLS